MARHVEMNRPIRFKGAFAESVCQQAYDTIDAYDGAFRWPRCQVQSSGSEDEDTMNINEFCRSLLWSSLLVMCRIECCSHHCFEEGGAHVSV